MTEDFFSSKHQIALFCVLLPGLIGMLALIIFQLSIFWIPLTVLGLVSLGGYSYLVGRSFRFSKGFYVQPRIYVLPIIILVILLNMIAASALQEVTMYFLMATIILFVFSLTVGFLRTPSDISS
ncbi:MAG: hypothetical protein K9W43_03820 [Candidatus Thorarchaeota archaeon]|nr:hypothetical protein [Candidatus Thorarchaeota archaeon]